MAVMTLPSRLDRLPRALRLVLILLVLGLSAVSACQPPAPISTATTQDRPGKTDPELYRHVIARVSVGESYYSAAAAEQRARGYPLKPAFTMRLPTLAVLSAWLGRTGTVWTMGLLAIATVLAWVIRARQEFGRGPVSLLVPILIGMSCAVISGEVMVLFHECWAALLVALSLALHGPGRWRASLALAVTAALFRETAAAYLLLMLAAAAWERNWREVAGWIGGLLVLAVAFWLHARTVSALAQPGDLVSPGWSGMGGWMFFLASIRTVSPLVMLPGWMARALIPLALAGWLLWRNPLALRVFGLIAGYALALMVFARPDTWYWATIPALLLPAGLALLPLAAKGWRAGGLAAKPAL